MIRCRLFGHKFIGSFEEFIAGRMWRSKRPTNYCVRCGAPRETQQTGEDR